MNIRIMAGRNRSAPTPFPSVLLPSPTSPKSFTSRHGINIRGPFYSRRSSLPLVSPLAGLLLPMAQRRLPLGALDDHVPTATRRVSKPRPILGDTATAFRGASPTKEPAQPPHSVPPSVTYGFAPHCG